MLSGMAALALCLAVALAACLLRWR